MEISILIFKMPPRLAGGGFAAMGGRLGHY